ncbi:membrane protein [Cohnella kolymensis]|uniref:Membrane protein n=1 Tax=Cohnella kolymensis TaxID=1590652 RepID=A0ABR5A7A2_9BACL|nr:DUF421 domain-containing protein [Cohnella kolymensis]KIL36909.1 membrane protein [Cohnella kolymensis]
MEVAATLLRTLGMYVFVFLVLRLMGKREIGKLSVFDLVISIMIAEIAAMVIEQPAKPVWMAIAPIALLLLIQIGIAYITLKSHFFRRWFEGTPTVIIRHGHINRKVMGKERYNLNDLMTHLRQNRITNIEDVELAVLESTGELSVIPRRTGEDDGRGNRDAHPDKPDAYPKVRYEMLPLSLILDGHVQDENLQKLGKTRFWLKTELQKYGIDNFKHVFFCSVDHRGKLYVDKK